jgi:transcriptional regulator with XRE-family HTH domain
MAPSGQGDVGWRIAAARGRRGLTQQDLAQLAGVSLSLLKKIEQNSRPATDDVRRAITRGLGVDEDELFADLSGTPSKVHTAIPLIRRIVGSLDHPEDGPIRPLDKLTQATATLVGYRVASQYGRLSEELPSVLSELARAAHSSSGTANERAGELLVQGLRAADGIAYKFGYLDLSAWIIERMRRTSEQLQNELVGAATAYVHTETFFATGDLAAAEHTLNQAASRISPPKSMAAAATYASLHMRAAVVAARARKASSAIDHLAEARQSVARVREGVYYGTACGSASVRIHEVAVAVELGDATGALRAAKDWAPPTDLPAERRSHFYIDLASAQLWAGHRDHCLTSLQAARQIAPQHVREHPRVKETVQTLLRLSRRPDAALVGFAGWLSLI